MLRKISFILIIFAALFINQDCVLSHNSIEEHNEEIEYVLFGDRDFKSTHPMYAEKIKAIEYAVGLCIDEFNMLGIKNFEFLQTRNIPNFPKSMEEFNFWDSPARHRYYTHRGWNLGDEDKAHWSVRQQLLLNTIDKELFSTENVIAGFFSDVFQKDNYEKKQRESFAILLYYVHILGDHLEAGKKTTPMDKMNAVASIAPLTRPNYDTKNNPAIVPELIECVKILFKSQDTDRYFNDFVQDLEEIRERSSAITDSKGGLNTENFVEYNKCAEDLLESLASYVPTLLKKEDFFRDAFCQ